MSANLINLLIASTGQTLYMVAVAAVLGTVLGLPLGRTVGLLCGWRVTFLVIAAAALLCLLFLLKNLPVLPSKDSGSLKSLPIIFQRKGTNREAWGRAWSVIPSCNARIISSTIESFAACVTQRVRTDRGNR